MARFTTKTFTITDVGSGQTKDQSEDISTSTPNIYKVKIVPSLSGGTQILKIYTKDARAAGDLIYMLSGGGSLYDPALYDGSAYTEAKVGFLFPYEDEDSTSKIHVSVTNNDTQTKNYTITIIYE